MMDYDLIVIGAGPGGYEAALKAAKNGMKTLLLDKRAAGGTCLHVGCIPTKALLHASGLYRGAADGATIGVSAQGMGYDIAKIYENKNAIVGKLEAGLGFLFKQHKVDYVNQAASIRDAHTVSAGDRTYTARHLLIATGSDPALPPIPGIETALTSDQVLRDPVAYGSVIIIGGGVIGVEFASFYNDLGKQVTILEAEERLLPLMDREISQNLSMIMKKRGVQIYTGALVSSIEQGLCRFTQKGEAKEAAADAVIVATGRKPYTQGLFEEGFAVEMNRGFVSVDSNFQTSVPGVYAIGDVTGGMMLAHAATAQGSAAVDHMLGRQSALNLSAIPSCVYTSPEIACVGLTQDQAKETGISVKVCKYSMLANGKSMIQREERGFIKLVVEEATGKVLGGQLMCGRASDLIAAVAMAVAGGLSVEAIQRTVFPHPTFCEGIGEAARAYAGD